MKHKADASVLFEIDCTGTKRREDRAPKKGYHRPPWAQDTVGQYLSREISHEGPQGRAAMTHPPSMPPTPTPAAA